MGAMSERQIRILSELWHLRERLDKNTILCMLLLRQLSLTYRPANNGLAMERQTQNKAGCAGSMALTAWDIVVERQGDSYANAVKKAMEKLSRENFQMRELLENVNLDEADEGALEDAVRLFSNLHEDVSVESIYETFLGWEPVEVPTINGDFYTPRQVITCMQDLVNADTSLYDPCCGSGALLVAGAKTLALYGQTIDTYSRKLTLVNLTMRGRSINLGHAPANTLSEDMHMDLKFNAVLANPPFNQKDWSDHGNYREKHWRYGLPPRSNANFAWLQHVLSKLEEDGKAAVIMPNSTLTTTNHRELAIRRGMLEDGVVEAIIMLPPKLFYTTKIPTCIWVLKQKIRKERSVLLIDLPRLMEVENKTFDEVIVLPPTLIEDWSKGVVVRRQGVTAASYHEIQLNRYSLSPNHYRDKISLPYTSLGPNAWEEPRLIINLLRMEGSMSVKCADRLEVLIHNAVGITGWQQAPLGILYDIFGGLSMQKPEYGHGTPLVDVKTILHNHFVPQTLPMYAVVEQAKREKHDIRRGDVLVNRTSENLEQLGCGCVADEDIDAVYVGFAKRLRPCSGGAMPIYHRYVAGYFRSRVYREEVKHIAPVFTTRASLKEDDIASVLLYYPAMEWQQEIGDALYAVHEAIQKATPRGKFMLRELQTILVENLITNPVLRWLNEGKERH